MRTNKGMNRVALALVLTLVIIVSLGILIFVNDFIGRATINANAGSISYVQIHHSYDAVIWHGFYGTARLDYDNELLNWNRTVTGGNITKVDLNFNCFGRTGFDFYVSTVPEEELDASSLVPATPQEIDDFIGINYSDRKSASSTYHKNFSLFLGGLFTITGPGIVTYATTASEENNTFHFAAFKDGDGDLVFGLNASTSIPGYRGELANYQLMVPVPIGQPNITYWFFPDPISDPLGDCLTSRYAIVSGYVNASDTNLSAPDVLISIGNSTAVTDMNGYFQMLAPIGDWFLIGVKDGYFDYVNFTTIHPNRTNEHNFTMLAIYNKTTELEYGFLEGYVTEINGTIIENVTVRSGVYQDVTDDTGFYRIIAQAGENITVVAVKTSYQTNLTYVDIEEMNTTYFNFTLIPLPSLAGPDFGGNATIWGYTRDNETNETIANVSIYIGWWQIKSNESGFYNFSLPATDFYKLIAIKSGYESYVGDLVNDTELIEGESLRYDIYMEELNILENVFFYEEPPPPPGGAGDNDDPPGPEGISNITQEELEQLDICEEVDGLVIKDQMEEIAAYLSLREIKVHIKKDTFIEQSLALYNFKDQDLNVDFSITGDLDGIFLISDNSIRTPPHEYGELGITIMGLKPPGIYRGHLEISGDIETRIPVEIVISKEGRIPINTLIMQLEVLKKTVVQGQMARYKLDLVNLLTDRTYDVDINVFIAYLNGTRISDYQRRNITLETITSLVGQVEVPRDLEPGDYIIRAQADYLSLSSSADALFTVREPVYEYEIFGIIPVWLLTTILLVIAISFFVGMEIKKRQEAKKRFHAKVEYDLLPSDGDRSLFIGVIAETTRKAYIDMDKLTVHTIVAGSTGGGKSISSQDIVEEALLKGVAVCVFDPTAQWSGMLRKLQDKKFLEFYPKFGMNPKKDPKAFNGNIKAVKNGREIINIFKYMKEGEIQIFTTNTLDPKDYDVFVASMIQQIFRSKLDEFRGLKYMLVFDEIHRILPKFGGSGAGFTQIERGCREFRKWGIGIVLISQVLSDFVGEIKANINTLVQMKTRDEGDLNRIKMQYGEEYIQSLVKSPVGSGMVQNGAWNRGRPYYVTFRPILHSVVRLKDEELDEYNKYNEIVDQIEYELEQLEELKQDVFDLKLELKLSKDKIKSGNFNMVQIYLDGLTPRVQKMWEKVGQKPKKLEIQLLAEEEIAAAVTAAKAKKKAEEKSDNKGDGGGDKKEGDKEGGEKEGGEKEGGEKEGGDKEGGEKKEEGKKEESASEVSKEEKTPEPAKEDSKPNQTEAQETKSTTPQNGELMKNFTVQFNQAKTSVGSKDKASAINAYKEMSEIYKQLADSQKKVAYQYLAFVNNQIRSLG